MRYGEVSGRRPELLSRCIAFGLAAFFAFAVLIFLHPSSSGAETTNDTTTVDATGFATISGGNTAIARDNAINDGLAKAVEQAVGTMVAAETLVENYQVLKDSVYTKTQGYIKNYTVTGESQTGNMYQVNLRATVAVGNLKSDLDAIGLLHAKAEKPRVLFMIAEQNIGHKYYVFWWWGRSEYMGETVDMSSAETAMKEQFLGKGFNVVDISGSMDTIDISNAFKVADLTDAGARQIGKKLNAEVVVKGKALAKEGPRTPGSSVGSYLADVTVQAIRIDTGGVLGSAKGHGVVRHVSDVTGGSDSIAKAAQEAGDKLIEQILAKWSAGNNVILRISGITDYKKVADLKNMLKKEIRGVAAVYQRRFEGGEAVFELETKVPASNIADDLTRLQGINLKVRNTTGNTIDAVSE
ncbi:MAG: hypothetical protein HY887_03275 [Deltaproteobacteria bacterium]|nr:hypothetical protein [Deltaproteobacteria bacterium]